MGSYIRARFFISFSGHVLVSQERFLVFCMVMIMVMVIGLDEFMGSCHLCVG
jgi:hypothetical protein